MMDDPEVVAIVTLGLARAVWAGNGHAARLHAKRVPGAMTAITIGDEDAFEVQDEQQFETAIALAVASRLRRHGGPARKVMKLQRPQETPDRCLKMCAPYGERASLTAVLPQEVTRAGGVRDPAWATSSVDIATAPTAHWAPVFAAKPTSVAVGKAPL